MADPFSIATGVARLISLGIQVTESLAAFYTSYKTQDANVARTTAKLENLLKTFRNLDGILKNRTFEPDEQNLTRNIESSIQSCEELIRELQDECGKLNKASASDMKSAIKIAGRRAAYPFRQSTLQKLDEDIGEIRDNLSLALDVLHLENQKKAEDDIAEVKLLLALVNATQISSSVRDWLKAPNASINHNSACAKRHPDTGMWFINGPYFTTWLKQDGSFLWLNGPAGCGKSVLCATAIQHAFRQKHSGVNVGIAFFYFTFSDNSKQDESAMLRALLLQLSGQLSDGQAILELMRTSIQAATPPTTLLIEHLRNLIPRFHQVYILLDALDESPRYAQRDQVLNALQMMRKWSLPMLHLLVTSRDEPDIRDTLDPAHNQILIMKSAGIDKDISDFISSQLDVDPKLRKWKAHHAQIRNALIERAQGVFRWVGCQFESLKRCPRSESHLDRCLHSLPRSLDETYERMLCSIDESSVEDARRILTLLCFSFQPLTVPELIEGIAVDLDEPARLNCRRRLQDADDIRNICPGLIDINDHVDSEKMQMAPIVRLAHFSVQEYLESDRITKQKAANFALQSAPAHAEIAQIFLVYLLEPELSSGPLHETINTFPLALAAAAFWSDHYRNGGAVTSQLKSLISRLFSQQNSLRTWLWLYRIQNSSWVVATFDIDSPSTDLPIICASYFGLDEALYELLALMDSDSDRKILIDSPSAYPGLFPLAVASEEGHEKVVRVLLDAGADVSVGGNEAIYAASRYGHKNVVQILLNSGLDRAGVDRAMMGASEYGDGGVVKMLIDAGADVNARDEKVDTALQVASEYGHGEVVKILIHAGADVNVKGSRDTTALQVASNAGRDETVKILLDAGADVNAEGGRYGTALYAASSHPWLGTMKMLLDAGAHVNTLGGKFGTALHAASRFPDPVGVEILLAAGADTNMQGRLGTALHEASRFARAKTVEVLLNAGADVNAAGAGCGATALELALAGGERKVVGMVDVIQKLLDAGALDERGEVRAFLEIARQRRSGRYIERN
ncbi:uncharacterized protein A1O5_01991 [Cladophialophora psammophila CBS 110553]|uniref:NACHT domain-containing protein n=1 Tax=Cladophialophora psammophila CBS 110553 TaxID=1182543 RepID=W9XD70_9EURO|nr:uncharacterized protein A1O5_01991 [Cladophialophora psammophila CBS 110553]EXJ75295.1 hypothetical protein A1O5_01991 [Cladophialophora psammophila CBS 110553]